ncbi:MAG: hypothetical protein ACFFD5_08120 [Candidatus Thorarchaeota archaeon]
MSILSEEEIERLKKTHPKKKILRLIFLLIGLLFIAFGFILLMIGFDFDFTIDGINVSFIIDILIIVFGMVIASKYFIAPYYIRENSLTLKRLRNLREPVEDVIKFFSLSMSRLIAALILIIAGIISFNIFGLDVGHEVKYGSAVVLGGPSWFYVTGLPILGIGFTLLLYFFLSPFHGTFSKSKNFFFFYEIRPGFPWLTEIVRDDIEAIRYQNNHLGPKFGWLVFFMPFIVLQLMTAIPLFGAERAAPEYTLSWTFVIITVLEIISLFFLVLTPQNYFEIATKDRLYEMWFSPLKFRKLSQFKEKFSEYLSCNFDSTKTERMVKNNNEYSLFEGIRKTHFHLLSIIFGLFLIVSAIIILNQMVLFGPLVWWIALIYGLILILKAFSFDFSNRNADDFYYDNENKIFKFKRKFLFKFYYISAFNVNNIEIRKWFRKLDFFDLAGICGLLIFLTVQQTEGWLVADTQTLIIDNLISTSYMIVTFIFIFFYLCLPIDVIEFKTPSITYRINITSKRKEENLFRGYLTNVKNLKTDLQKPGMKKTLLLRGGIMGLIIIGALVYIIFYFVFFF